MTDHTNTYPDLVNVEDWLNAKGYTGEAGACHQAMSLIRSQEKRIAELEMSIDANDKWAEGFIEKTEAHIEELKAALKPFAAVCDVWEDGKTGDNAERYFTLRVGDLRAARAALGEKNEDREG